MFYIIFQSIQPATYDDLSKHINNIEIYDFSINNIYTSNTIVKAFFIMLIIVIMLVIATLLISFKLKSTFAKIICIIICLIITILSCITTYNALDNYKNNKIITYELKHKDPHYRTFTVSGEIDNIRNGTEHNQQDIKFKDSHHETYFVTISSNVPVKKSDKITVKVNKQLVDNGMNLYDLSESINNSDSFVTINHNNQKYNTKLIQTTNFKITPHIFDVYDPNNSKKDPAIKQ